MPEDYPVPGIEVRHGTGPTEYGPGVDIILDENEVAKAIDLWLHSQGVIVRGPRTILGLKAMRVYVDPSGFVVANGMGFYGSGRGD